ncbi:MAG: right-handed parallel beta-helix repeat-containing protein [Proteobacteria bacterium]|nr:right-handed parallel beta-helix repeat-containing protein [Pseudomonadota bacterium]
MKRAGDSAMALNQGERRERPTLWTLAFWALMGVLALPCAHAQSIAWLDSLGYQKPQPVTLNEPSEATVTNKYWIDLSSGSGTTCSQSSPCGSFASVIGKAGTTGGPAVIYVKGTGGMSLFGKTLYGSGNADCRSAPCSNWILIRTWPAGTPGCATECTAVINGDSNINSPSGVHHLMIDGGPNLRIQFNSNAGAGTYANHIIADYVIVYRTQTYCTGANKQLGWSVGDTSVSNHDYFINNEFWGCAATGDQSSAIYAGPGSGGGYTDLLIQNNIIRDFFGEGVEINPRVTSSGLTIVGNAFHNTGKGTCSTSWQCRPGIVVSVQSGGGNNNTVIENNLIWDTGSGCYWDRGGGSPNPLFANNTCYDFGKGSGGGGPNPQGVSGYSNGGTATLLNNVIYAPNGTDALDGSSFAASNNLCASTTTCGSSNQIYSSATLVSTDPTSGSFLQIGTGSDAIDTGTTVSGETTSYAGGTRPQGKAFDIGAFEFGAGYVPPSSPTSIGVK